MEENKNKRTETLSVQILERFMDERELKHLFEGYEKAKLRKSYLDRFSSLDRPVTENERLIIKRYYTQGQGLKELAEELGLSDFQLDYRVREIARRLVWQNKSF